MKTFKLIKSLFNKNNLLYTIIFILGLAIIVTNRVIVGFADRLWFIDIASIFGLLYIIFVAKHSVWGIVFSLISNSLLFLSSAMQHLWLNACVAICVSIPSLIIGIVMWKKNEKSGASSNLKALGKKNLILLCVGYAIASVIFAYILYLLNGNLFYLDAVYSAGCAIGLVLCAFAFIDQFYFFIFCNFFGIAMYIILSVQNLNNLPMVFTDIIYQIMNTIAYLNWRKLMKAQQNNANNVEQNEDVNEKL